MSAAETEQPTLLRVLVLSREPWRDDSNEGSVLTSLFSDQPFALANLYCKPGLPQNNVCSHYFQLTDRMALENIVKRTPMGRAFTIATGAGEPAESAGEAEKKGFYDFFRRHQWEIFFSARQALWSLADFKSPALDAFVRAFAPDVIFAPLCYDRNILSVQRYVIGLAGCPAATYLYDDLYSLRQFRFSPLFWLNRFALRRAIRKTLPFYQTIFSLSPEQAEAYSAMLHRTVRVLPKAAPWPEMHAHASSGGAHPMRVLYAGGIYYGRDRVLARVVEACKACGAQLVIHSNSPLSPQLAAQLNDGVTSFLYPAVPAAALKQAYAQSDVALYADAFDRRNRCVTRLSFSSKIVDCLSSGCAVLAICSKEHAGLSYLRRNRAALCVDAPDQIAAAVRALADDPAYRDALAKRALDCAHHEHAPEWVRSTLRTELARLAGGRGGNQEEGG